jgi:hypothetical protein
MRVKIAKSQIECAGLGVFATEAALPGDVLEECHVIVLRDIPDGTGLWNYQLEWDQDDCIAGGCCLFYNHSDDPNCTMLRKYSQKVIQVVALRPVQAGQELLIQYRCGSWW